MTTIWIGLAVAGAAGAVCRYLLDRAVAGAGLLPRGTLVINVSGSLLLGLITGAALYHGLAPTPKVILGTGFCGAYTTFSTWSYETVRLAEKGRARTALLNVTLSLGFGLAAAAIGLAVAAL